MLRKQKISLVIPCKNEASSLRKLLPKVPSFVDEVLVVDNDSTDKTILTAKYFDAKIVQEFRKDVRGIGYGFAHQRGIQKATGDIVITLDGDGTYPLHAIKSVVTHLVKNELDFISCRRYPLIRAHAVSRIRQLGVRILNQEVRLLFGYPIHDILSGMWVARRSTLKKMQLKEGGWNLSPEIKLRALTDPSISFAEYHIDHMYRSGGVSKQSIWITGLDHLQFIARFWLIYSLAQATNSIKQITRSRALPQSDRREWAAE